ncbi:MAG: CDGSH iron-sulfur domain-containing protein [Gammaproteobacteria bacterium]|nr:CDGSH iron-sulfur domain-containing protein [Gammaproteobacteria bacterium]
MFARSGTSPPLSAARRASAAATSRSTPGICRRAWDGPYAVRANIQLDGERGVFRATLCRCGASRNKPFCDGSHNQVKFTASGEPSSGKTDMLAVRDGVLAIDPETDGPLRVRGNLEITSGTGRVVARVTQARLCRCGGSGNKPFCDGTHAKIGFRSSAT